MAQIVVFPDSDYNPPDGGQTYTISAQQLEGFNDRLSSLIVIEGTFTLFADRDYQGASFTVCSRGGPDNDGRYPSPLWLAGRDNGVSSIRRNSDQPPNGVG
jgi:hypothetical protein